METLTDWQRIRQLAGPSLHFPNQRAYAFGSMSRFDTPWLLRFRKEAEENGLGTDVKAGVLYVLVSEKKRR